MTSLYIPTQSEIDHQAEQMTVRYTGDNKRIAKAAQLVAMGAVDYASEAIGWTVDSQRSSRRQDPESPEPWRYSVTRTSCTCPDHMVRASAVGQCGDAEILVRPACKHIYAVQMYLRIIAARMDSAMQTLFGPVYGIESRTDDLFGIYDRDGDSVICAAIFNPRTSSYRPQDGKQAALFARWLANQPVQVEFTAGGIMERILRTAPGSTITLRADVVYGDPNTYTLAGYRWEGATWQYLEYASRQPFNETAWYNLLAATGWSLTSRPVRQPGVAIHYLLERNAGDKETFAPGARSADDIDDRRLLRQATTL